MVPLHEVTFLLETGAFTRDTVDEDEISEDLHTFVGNESDIEREVEETETRLSESKSFFTSSVEYPYTFCEVAFLIHKLYQCANRRFKLRDRRNPIESIEDKTEEELHKFGKMSDKNDNEAVKKEKKKLLLKLNIEKLSRMQSHQLNFISALSTRNKRRNKC